MTRRCALLFVAAHLVLTGCSGDQPFNDLSRFMAKERSRPAAPPEPLPGFLPYRAFTYSASGERSPFDRPVATETVLAGSQGESVRPDPERARHLLESFAFDTFTMVGTLEDSRGRYALLSVNGRVHRVGVGDYLGRNHGRVVRVTGTGVHLMEIVRNGQDAWVQRPRTLSFAAREPQG